MNKYYIRYNTQHEDTDLVWRVICNNTEVLVKSIQILVPSFGDTTVENNITKYNIACFGELKIENDEATIF